MSNNHNMKIVFGAMTFGNPNTLGARVHEPSEASDILDVFQHHGHHEVDTARIYGGGSSEKLLASISWKDRGLSIATKIYPNANGPAAFEDSYTHQPVDIRRGLMNSLKALNTDTVDLFYLHAPDRKTGFEETLAEINQLYEESRFARFGLSNYMAWEVAQICEICKKNNWIMPTVYQGVYHLLQRSIESELIPCLRKYGLSLYAFQPLAGGLLTGRYRRDQTVFETGSRFDPSILQGSVHRDRYWNDAYFDALEHIDAVAGKYGLAAGEIALRWLKHHLQLKHELDDAIIAGASHVNHLESNLARLEKGPLPDEVVRVVKDGWLLVKGVAPNYWH